MLKTKEEIIKWLDKYDVSYYTIRDDLTVDVGVDVNLAHKRLEEIPIQFGIVDGSFYCDSNQLTSLKGCPIEVRGDFYCSGNKLTSLEYAPNLVEGNFNCAHNHLISINDLNCRIMGNFTNSYYYTQPYKIMELNGYYQESTIHKNTITVTLSGKDLENIVCEKYLQKNLPINDIKQKKLKI
jgi:hypothetical protein